MKNLARNFAVLAFTAGLSAPSLANTAETNQGGGHLFRQQRGCFSHIEHAGSNLRHQLNHLARIASQLEGHGQTAMVARRASRQVGTFEYQVSRTCNANRLLVLRERVRDALNPVRQAFRASDVLSSTPRAFESFRAMVDRWETLRDLVTDAGNSGPGPGCFAQVISKAQNLRVNLNNLAQVAAQLEFRGQTQFVAGNAQREVTQQIQQLRRTCNRNQAVNGREQIRNRLDAVRQAFRASQVLSNNTRAFQAFRNMVNSWESYRDSVSDI